MKTFLKITGIVLLVAILSIIIYLAVTFPPAMSGMTAKMVCSCVYVTGRDLESVKAKELQVFPGLSKAKIEFDEDSSVRATILWSTSEAIYRKGLGCTLLAERSNDEVRKQNVQLPKPPDVNQDTIPWPQGNLKSGESVPGVDYGRIKNIIDSSFINDPEKPWNTHGIVVLYDGQIVGEQYAEGFTMNSRLMGWSMGKSITNALVGILIREGKLNLNDPAPIPEWQNDDRASIRLEQLLQATSGLTWTESYFNPRSDFHKMFTFSDDKGGYALNKKLSHQPGEFFQYSSGTTNIISKIIRSAVGDTAYYKFPYEKLFNKTGMNSMVLEPDASGTFVGSSYAFATARDWARFGLLFLNDGTWNGERILPEGWVELSTIPSQAAPLGEYGAQWWLNAGKKNNPANRKYPELPTDVFWADGFEEQYVMVIPSKNLVVVRLGVSHYGFPFEKMAKNIIDCLPGEVIESE